MSFIDVSGEEWDELYPSTATFQAKTAGAKNDRGVPVPGAWTNVTGLVAKSCQIVAGPGEEVQGIDGAKAMSTHTVHFREKLAVTNDMHFLDEDGLIYEVLVAGADPSRNVSVIKARRTDG